MNTYSDRFGGENVSPAMLDYVAIAMTDDVTLVWPFQTGAGEDFAAHKIDITADAGGYNLTFPDAQMVSPGQDVMINNTGSYTVTIKSATGTTLGTVASGEMWLFYLTSNATEGGTWRSVQLGTGTSSASAASLAGFGLVAQSTTLAQQAPLLTKNANYTFTIADRAGSFDSTGGAVTFSFDPAATLTNGWFAFIRNSGSGTLTLDPSGAETIDGAATKALAVTESCIVVSNGTSLNTFGYGRALSNTVSSIAINLAGTGVYTLSSSELAAQIQNYTGLLTGNREVRVGTAPGYFFVYNNTTGAFTVTFEVNGADPGVVVAQGSFSILRSDGTNIVSAFTATTGTVTSVGTGTDLTGGPITTTGTITHANSGVAAGTYGDASTAVTIAVNARGHLTSVLTSAIAAAWAALTGVPAAITALASLTPAADKLGYFTSGTTAALADLTSYGRSLIAAVDAAAARTVLGLGTAATQATTTFLQVANNLSDLANAATARGNLGVTYASQTEQEAATATNRVVAPGTQQYHPGSAKAWSVFQADGTLLASYNLDSVSKSATGEYDHVFTVDFSSVDYSCVAMANTGNGAIVYGVINKLAGSCTVKAVNSNTSLGQDYDTTVVFYGDQ